MSWRELFLTGSAQHGVVTLSDAEACGVSRSTFLHRVEREGWRRLHPGVWALPGGVDSPMRDSAAALAAAGPHALLARRSAAWLWGLRDHAPPRPEVLVRHAAGRPRLDGIVVVQSRTARPERGARVHGLRVTPVARTLGDLARGVSDEQLVAMIIAARRKGLVDLSDLAVEVGVRRKAQGVRRFRAAVEVCADGAVDSMLEREVRDGLAAALLPPPHPEPVWLGSGPGRLQIDIAWPERKVGIEVDGFAHHSDAEDLARDHRKTNVLAAAGWVLLRVGYLRWRRERGAVLGEVRAVLAAHPTVAEAFAADNGKECLRNGDEGRSAAAVRA